MLRRSARKHLTRQQELIASQHFVRFLKRWAGNLTASRYARLWANARCLALHPERLTSEYGWRLRRQRAAKAAYAKIRSQGRVPGSEGRAAIERNRNGRKFAKEMEEQYGPSWRYGRTNMNGI